MHHPTDRITHTTAFVTPVVEHWLEQETANGSIMKDRSDDLSHHERTLYQGATSRSLVSHGNENIIMFKIGSSKFSPVKSTSYSKHLAVLLIYPCSLSNDVCCQMLITQVIYFVVCSLRSEMQLRGKSVRSWCDGSSDRSFMGWTH